MKKHDYINPMDIPAQLLSRYGRSGPRYTSYPTAPHFKSEFPVEIIKDKWRASNQKEAGQDNALSLYTHFPFCNTRCLYCGCYTRTTHSPQSRETYLQGLKNEVTRIFELISPERPLKQLALGGGTPTSMSAAQLQDYVRHLESHVTFSADAERSIEVDPRSVDTTYLSQLLEVGFNRFSFGVQDLDPTVQGYINRPLERSTLQELTTFLRSRGVEAMNIDLIYGLPGQTEERFSATIASVIQMAPSRIALFGYAHVPWMSPHQKHLEKHGLPNPEERMKLFGLAFHLLLEAGYQHVGMDHFALPQDKLITALNNRTLTRNFMGYTTERGLDLVGIGASSISSVGGTYTQNLKDIDAYTETAELPQWIKGLILSAEDELRREIILDLFCNFYLDTHAVEKKFKLDFSQHFEEELQALRPMEADGLLEIAPQHLEVTETGRFFIRNICMVFDTYLAKETGKADKRYSKTI